MNHYNPLLTPDDERPLRELLSRFRYRPGWRFYINAGILFIEAQVIDANDPELKRICALHFRRAVPRQLHDDFPWQRWLLDIIFEIERHEAMEFFQVDGLKPFDPHREDDRTLA